MSARIPKRRETGIFIRSIDARSLTDVFLISAITTILLVRFFLHITGYPQVGSSQYHIAHMLWGGLLMMMAVFMSLMFFGRKVQRLVAFVGGVGFGIFIDELGKFITRDNNYFYQPTVGLIYALLAIIYILSSMLTNHEHLSRTEYQLNALRLIEDAIRNDLDHTEKQRIKRLLRMSGNGQMANKLTNFIEDIETIDPPKPPIYRHLINSIESAYDKLLRTKRSDRFIQIFSVSLIIISVGGIFAVFNHSYSSVLDFVRVANSESLFLERGQIFGTVLASAFATLGVIWIIKNRYRAFYWFNIALITNIFLTQFFMFARIQFNAIPFLLLNIILLLIVRFVMARELYHNPKVSNDI